MKTEFWYSVENGGDGSAYPIFMESRELAVIHQKYLIEGWGEECIGCEIIESEDKVEMIGVTTVEDMIKEVLEYMEYNDDEDLKKKLDELNQLLV